MQLHIPSHSQHCRRRISTDARRDLTWWLKVLRLTPERSIAKVARNRVGVWTDASRKKGLGAFYISETETDPPSGFSSITRPAVRQPKPGAAFLISLPRYLTKPGQHINTKEMGAVEQAFLHWGKKWKGMKVIIHTDNKAVAHAIVNQNIRGG